MRITVREEVRQKISQPSRPDFFLESKLPFPMLETVWYLIAHGKLKPKKKIQQAFFQEQRNPRP